jgi:hypothetical protein
VGYGCGRCIKNHLFSKIFHFYRLQILHGEVDYARDEFTATASLLASYRFQAGQRVLWRLIAPPLRLPHLRELIGPVSLASSSQLPSQTVISH